MVRGVSFEISQANDTMLWEILSCINLKQYYWYNIDSQNEAWTNPSGEPFFKANYYDGDSFSKLITSTHFIIFLKLQAYLEEGRFLDIYTYKDFQNSDCQLLILINDCKFIEIYIKDQSVINLIYNNALSNKYNEVEYITDENDVREKMNVL